MIKERKPNLSGSPIKRVPQNISGGLQPISVSRQKAKASCKLACVFPSARASHATASLSSTTVLRSVRTTQTLKTRPKGVVLCTHSSTTWEGSLANSPKLLLAFKRKSRLLIICLSDAFNSTQSWYLPCLVKWKVRERRWFNPSPSTFFVYLLRDKVTWEKHYEMIWGETLLSRYSVELWMICLLSDILCNSDWNWNQLFLLHKTEHIILFKFLTSPHHHVNVNTSLPTFINHRAGDKKSDFRQAQNSMVWIDVCIKSSRGLQTF